MWPVIIGLLFLALRLAGDFDGLWRRRRPYLDALALSFFLAACVGFYGLAAWMDGDLRSAPRALRQTGRITPEQVAAHAHPWLALLSAGLFIFADRWPAMITSLRPASGLCVCGYPRELPVCPECGSTEFRSSAARLQRRMPDAWLMIGAAALLGAAAIGTYSPP